MLSFLREQGSEKPSAPKSSDPPGQTGRANSETQGQADPQTRKEVFEEPQEYFTVVAQNKNVRNSTIMVAVLFGMGLLCLWFMIRRSTPETALASPDGTDETQIEMAIARLTGASSEMFGRMDQIVKKFYEFSDVLQVKVNELVKNPFELELFLSSLKEKVDLKEDDIDINAEMIRQQQIKQKAKDMQLYSIMRSEQGDCCMIDNKVLYEGDLIRGFKVTQIGGNFVKLEWWDTEGDSAPLAPQSTRRGRLEIVLKLSK